jgi:hypothetical protein
MSGFTKGPWIVIERSMTDIAIGSNDYPIAEVSFVGEVGTLANAKLLAAAPDLYEALEAMISDFGYGHMDDANLLHELNEGNETVRCLIKARAALQKAKGEK